MSYTKKVAFNTAAQFLGKAVGIVISLVTIGILFRFLGVEGTGKYSTVFAYVSFFSLFADMGLGWTMLRELATKSTKEEKSKVFQNIFTIRIILGLIVFVLAAAFIWFFSYTPDVKLAVGILAIGWFFQSLTQNTVQIYLNSYRMEIAVASEIVGKLVILLIVYLVWRMNGNLLGVMVAYVAGCLVNFIIDWLLADQFIKTGLAYDKKYWNFVIRQAVPIGITLVFGYIYYKVDSLMLSLLKGMTDVGIYSAPYKLLEVLQMIPALFLGSSFSLITKYINEKDERLSSAFQKQFDFLSFMVMPLVIGTFILAVPIIRFITGSDDQFINASTINIAGHSMTSVYCLRILIFSVSISFFSTLYNFLIVSLGRQKKMLWPTIGFALFNIGINFYLIPRYSYIGASIATVLTEAAVFLTARYVAKQDMKLSVNFKDFGKIFFSAVVMGVVCYIVYHYSGGLFLSLIASVVVYAIMVIIMKVVPISFIEKGFKGIKI